MPMYEYRCEACQKQFELRQKFSDPPVTECPECGGKVNKLISSTSFALKGGGWYDQGYGSGSSRSESAPACPGASGGGCAGCPSAGA